MSKLQTGSSHGSFSHRTAGNARQAQLQEQMIDFDEVVVKPYRLVSASNARSSQQDDLLRKVVSVAKQRAAGKVGGNRTERSSPSIRPPPTPLTPPSRDGRAFSEPSVPLWSAVEKAMEKETVAAGEPAGLKIRGMGELMVRSDTEQFSSGSDEQTHT